MFASKDAVKVEGLRELQRGLRQLDPQLQTTLRNRLKAIGAKVAARTIAKMPRRSGKAAGTVKTGVTATSAYVQYGRKAVPYVGWLDFGGVLRPSGNRHNTQSRPRVKEGRYLFPTIAEMRPQIEREAVEAFEETARDVRLK